MISSIDPSQDILILYHSQPLRLWRPAEHEDISSWIRSHLKDNIK